MPKEDFAGVIKDKGVDWDSTKIQYNIKQPDYKLLNAAITTSTENMFGEPNGQAQATALLQTLTPLEDHENEHSNAEHSPNEEYQRGILNYKMIVKKLDGTKYRVIAGENDRKENKIPKQTAWQKAILAQYRAEITPAGRENSVRQEARPVYDSAMISTTNGGADNNLKSDDYMTEENKNPAVFSLKKNVYTEIVDKNSRVESVERYMLFDDLVQQGGAKYGNSFKIDEKMQPVSGVQ